MELPIRYLNEKGQLDDGESSQLRYVYDIMYGEGEPYHNADWSVVIYPSEVKLVDIPLAAEIFAERYNTDQILCRYKYEEYLKNKDLQDTINGLGLDTDAFWLFHRLHIGNFSCHSLRKTFGRQVYNMNSENSELALVKLMELFNHSNVAITKRYLGLRQEELLNTYDCLSF